MIYRKRGATIRLERTRGVRTLMRLQESGIAEETNREFRCASSAESTHSALPSEERVLRIESSIDSAFDLIERIAIVAGNAEHEYGASTWTESHVRLHASLVRDSRRASIEIGGAEWDDASAAILIRVADALRRSNGHRARGNILLTPMVSAQLWPEILLAVIGSRVAAPIKVVQSTHPVYEVDGYGRRVEPFVLFDGSSAAPPQTWPNRYRPSYRTPPARAAFHLRCTLPVGNLVTEHEAVALLSPIRISSGRIEMSVLCSDGSIGGMDVDLAALRAAEGEARWFPVGAGSWGGPVAIAR